MVEKRTKYDVYFSEEGGYTSTQANYLANVAKENYEPIEEELNSASFYNSDIKTIGSENKDRVHNGWGLEKLEEVPDKMQAIINMKDLISYFREAVKARDTMIYDVKHTTVEEYAKMFGLEVPIRPQKETCITDNDVIAEMTIKERHDMLRL